MNRIYAGYQEDDNLTTYGDTIVTVLNIRRLEKDQRKELTILFSKSIELNAIIMGEWEPLKKLCDGQNIKYRVVANKPAEMNYYGRIGYFFDDNEITWLERLTVNCPY